MSYARYIVQPNHGKSTKTNKIKTAKYSPINFLPKNIFEQLTRFANVYFIFIIVLNWVPALNAFGKEIAMVPVIAVLVATGFKDLYEDIQRHRSDNKVNTNKCKVFRRATGEYSLTAWQDVAQGDLVRVWQDQQFPADLVLLSSSQQDGCCWIQTLNVDGETNLKIKRKVDAFEGSSSMFSGTLECTPPSREIDKFHGYILQEDGLKIPVTNASLLLRGCTLANTEYIEGLVVYTGHKTKLMMNSTNLRYKKSRMEKRMNWDVVWCAIILFVICLISSVGSGLCEAYINFYFLYSQEERDTKFAIYIGFLSFLTFIILYQVIIPLSLYVIIDLIKISHVYFINNDILMYNEKFNRGAMCKTLNIPEDLGQIEIIFSDKTGTLTENKMVFKSCSIYGQEYVQDVNYETSTFIPNKDLNDKLTDKKTVSEDEKNTLDKFFLGLAICNTVSLAVQSQHHDKTINNRKENMPESSNGYILNDIQVNVLPNFVGESTDEVALVKAAFVYNFQMLERIKDHIKLQTSERDFRLFKPLDILPFDSERKCMSVIIRNENNQILLFCKGADNVITAKLRKETDELVETLKDVTRYAEDGLRVLMIGYREISEEEYESWKENYSKAEASIQNKEMLVSQSVEEVETGLTLLGATAVEDRLQDNVLDTITKLREAGIVVWMLTGDKKETAINIARSSRLFSPQMDLIELSGETLGDMTSDEVLSREIGLVVNGDSLDEILENRIHLKKFMRLTRQCKAVLISRATPSQKGSLVRAVKQETGLHTLAIGDGANDVNMIQTADVGVGLSGTEGAQAVMAADFAITRFKDLQRLLLVHGFWSYSRLIKVVLHFFYKNAALILVLFWFQPLCAFSGQVMILPIHLLLSTFLYTSLPTIIVGVLERDTTASILVDNPIIYTKSRTGSLYTRQHFWVAILEAAYHSVVIFFISLGTSADSHVGLWEFGSLVCSSCVLVMLLQLAVQVTTWTSLHLLSFLLSLAMYYTVGLVYSSVCTSCQGYLMMQTSLGDCRTHLAMLLIVTLCTLPRVMLAALYKTKSRNS